MECHLLLWWLFLDPGLWTLDRDQDQEYQRCLMELFSCQFVLFLHIHQTTQRLKKLLGKVFSFVFHHSSQKLELKNVAVLHRETDRNCNGIRLSYNKEIVHLLTNVSLLMLILKRRPLSALLFDVPEFRQRQQQLHLLLGEPAGIAAGA